MSLNFDALRPNPRLSLGQKLWQINGGLVFLLLCLVGIGAAML